MEAGDEGMMKNNKKVGKRKKALFRLYILLFVFVVSIVTLLYLNDTRKEIVLDFEANLLWEVQQSSKDVSERFKSKFAVLETVQDLISHSYHIGEEAAKSMETSRQRYDMAYLGIVDRNYVYYDSSGDTESDIPHERVDLVLSGKRVVARSNDGKSPDGIIFLSPYWEDGEIVGVICSKYLREDMMEEVIDKPQEGTDLIVDVNGEVVFMDDDYKEYMGELSWEEFYAKKVNTKLKEQFDKELMLRGSAVAATKDKSGRQVYFAVSQIEGYPDFFSVRLTSAEVVEKVIQSSMVRIYLLMAFMIALIVCIVFYAVWTYIKNRKEVYKAAYVDQLTGIPSKSKHKLDAQELIDRQVRKYAYVTFDVDNFKYINEMFGYEYGNRILIHIANVLQHFTDEHELVARISADNFAMLLENPGTKEELSKKIKRIFEMIVEYREPEEELNLCSLKFSCGVYEIDEIRDINKIRANANLARAESKKRILDEIVFYDENLKTRRIEERELEFDAEYALENGEFLVYFQPKYDVTSEKIIGAEALVRWNHSTRGMLSPGLFIPVFESNGFIIRLDMYVLEKVCELIEAWLEAGIPPVCISVNLSRTHLYERDLVERLVSIVKKHNVPPEYIEFELTESAFYEETDRLLRVMEEIKKAGFRLSMDDFGSGYSSLNLLRRLPVDVLKLDRVFLEDCDEAEDGIRGKRIVMHVISMAKDLEMEVLAEGVETEGQKDFLQEAKCDMIQGYYYARPMPVKDFEALYNEQTVS